MQIPTWHKRIESFSVEYTLQHMQSKLSTILGVRASTWVVAGASHWKIMTKYRILMKPHSHHTHGAIQEHSLLCVSSVILGEGGSGSILNKNTQWPI